MQNLCDNGALIMGGTQLDETFRMHSDGKQIGTVATLGTFSEWQVLAEGSCVKVDTSIPLDIVSLVSCGVPTGWGSATNAANIEVGDVVVVIGCGGIGMNAVQGAAHKGAAHVVAVDPQPFKLEMALKLGATDTFADIEAATSFVRDITNGQGADSAIVTAGVVTGDHVASAFQAIRKAGTVVVTGVGHTADIPVSLFELTMFQKRIQGCLYGNDSPRKQIPRLLELYQQGMLKLDELISRRYRLDQINDGYADMHAGRNIRGIIDFSAAS
jgi:S-(hydroxymethyl)glutathione dehydrogenase/alcohol dehydrogenase